jgi:hypothetical protein
MSFDVHGRTRPRGATGGISQTPPEARAAQISAWLAVVAITVALAAMVVAALAHASWMGPTLLMPRTGPPVEIGSWIIPLDDMAIALWLSAIAGGLGVVAGLLAARRGARPPVRLLIVAAVVVVGILTVLPPVGSTDSLDYMAFGRMMVLGHSPYVMVPADLRHIHDAVAQSIPWEWAKIPTVYGPAATAEQFLAAKLGGTSAARIVFWLKLVNAIAFAAVAYIADRRLRFDPARRLRAHLLWTVNPLLIWQLIAAAHLDVLAAAIGLLGLVIAGGWPAARPDRRTAASAHRLPPGQPDDWLTLPETWHPPLGRILAGGVLIGVAADIKINFILFGAGLAWSLRRSAGAWIASVGAMLIVLLPTYAWFGPPAIRALLGRGNHVTADNFYQLFAPLHGFLMHHVLVIAAVLAVGTAIVTLRCLPGREAMPAAVHAALALSTAWLFTSQFQLPSYEAMVICVLIVAPSGWLDWLVIARLTAATIALMPGNPTPLQSPVLARIGADVLTLATPIVLILSLGALVVLCLTERYRPRPTMPRSTLAPPVIAG